MIRTLCSASYAAPRVINTHLPGESLSPSVLVCSTNPPAEFGESFAIKSAFAVISAAHTASLKRPAPFYSHNWPVEHLKLVGKLGISTLTWTVDENVQLPALQRLQSSLRTRTTACLCCSFAFNSLPCPFSNLPHLIADGFHPRIGPPLFILIFFLSTSFHSACSYIVVIATQPLSWRLWL